MSPATALAGALVLGILLAATVGGRLPPEVWPALAGGLSVAALGVIRQRRRLSQLLLLLALVSLAAGWAHWRQSPGTQPTAALEHWLPADGSLVDLEGLIVDGPYANEGNAGAFGPFGYAGTGTLLVLEVRQLHLPPGISPGISPVPQRVRGRVLGKIEAPAADLQPGTLVRAQGWLAGMGPQKNAADFDYRAALERQGIVARLTLAGPGNLQVLPAPTAASWTRLTAAFQQFRLTLAQRAAAALTRGLTPDADTRGLLQTLLLGQTQEDIDQLREDFRAVGLAHVLAISGAHLGILVGLTWVLLRGVLAHPPRAAAVLLLLLGFYILLVPVRVPILRAALMAGLYFGAVVAGRRADARSLLCLAAAIVLIWRPSDLFDAGAQLSFVTVWALLRFTQPVSAWLWPVAVVDAVSGTPTFNERGLQVVEGRGGWRRSVVDAVAVSLVAAVTTLPLVAWHFQMINPLAFFLSLLALPLVGATLAVGYVKVLAGLLWPSASLLLGGLLSGLAGLLATLVEQAAAWPGASWPLRYALPGWWALATVGLGWLILAGHFRGPGRGRVGMLSAVMLLGYAGWWQQPAAGAWLRREVVPPEHRAAATLDMLAVGDGSCFVLRSGGQTLVFDAGSQQYPLIGRRSIVPALRQLGVRRIDVLIVSHADLDHYNGCLDLVDAFDVGQWWVSPQVLDDAAAHPRRATAHLLSEMRRRGLLPQIVTHGHHHTLGQVDLQVLWPPEKPTLTERGSPTPPTMKDNDWSVVLAGTVAGRRLLLSGDVQQRAMEALFAADTDLHADVADLPHHGSFVAASVAWLDRVAPKVLLQSTGLARLRHDRWAAPLADRPTIARYISEIDGQTQVAFQPDGNLTVQSFLSQRQSSSAPRP